MMPTRRTLVVASWLTIGAVSAAKLFEKRYWWLAWLLNFVFHNAKVVKKTIHSAVCW